MYLCLLQCLQLVTKTCRCGQKQKEVLCSKQYLCETKCSAMRDCNKHQCKRKVCVHLIIVLYNTLQIMPLLKKMLLHITIYPSFCFALRFENLSLNVLKEIPSIKKTYGEKECFINVSNDIRFMCYIWQCCDGNCPSCEQVCGKLLSCKNHKCASGCHRGKEIDWFTIYL